MQHKDDSLSKWCSWMKRMVSEPSLELLASHPCASLHMLVALAKKKANSREVRRRDGSLEVCDVVAVMAVVAVIVMAVVVMLVVVAVMVFLPVPCVPVELASFPPLASGALASRALLCRGDEGFERPHLLHTPDHHIHLLRTEQLQTGIRELLMVSAHLCTLGPSVGLLGPSTFEEHVGPLGGGR